MNMNLPILKSILYATLVILISFILTFLYYCDTIINIYTIFTLNAEYDYIIVGAGSAGSTIAARLAQNSNLKILALEAGARPGPFFDIPIFGLILQDSVYDWNYETEVQKTACLGLKNNKSKWPMGKIVGGSGMFNNMIYARGDAHDFERWYRDMEEYNYENDVLWYFKKSENNLDAKNSPYHAIGGFLYAQDLKHYSILSTHILDGIQELNHPIRDINAEFGTGFMRPQVNQKNGRRWSTGHSLLQQIKSRTNLHLQTNALVTKLLFNGHQARGVEFEYLNQMFTIHVRKEVILSAGVVGSPKLLMLSGIGPKNHLKSIGIDCWNDLPVGRNLMDHITTGMDLVTINTTLSVNVDNILTPEALWDYFYNGRGPLTTPACEVLGTIQLNNTYPELGIMVMPLGVTADKGLQLRHFFRLTDKIWDTYFLKLIENGVTMVTLLPILLHPKSKGFIELHDANPKSKPKINPRYLTEQEDVVLLVEGIRFIQRLVKTDAMKKLDARIVDIPLPGCEEFPYDTDAYWECYVRHLTLTAYHPAGTCKMGIDRSSVVGYDFRVHNTKNLRIADASVIPYLTSANINAPVVMLAEKLVDHLHFNNAVCETRNFYETRCYKK